MILNDEQFGAAINLLAITPKKEITVHWQGRRYGGFTCRSHAEWVIRTCGWKDAEIRESPLSAPQ